MTPVQAKGQLHVVGTPIGNLEDITLRAIRILKECDIIAAEDTRVTSKLISRHSIQTKMVSFREQNAKKAIPKLIEDLQMGKGVALVTDAGTPSVSDPGVDLVHRVREAGIRVVPIPGPSSLASVISVAGLSGDGVRFVGFLPRRGKGRTAKLDAMAMETAVTVLYEAPNRLHQTLLDLVAPCGNRNVVVAREMTKVHEEIASGIPEELADRFVGSVKGEVTIVVEGAEVPELDLSDEQVLELIRVELDKGRSARDISSTLSMGLGVPRNRIYALTLDALKQR